MARVVLAGELAGEVAAERHRQEPHAHHLSDEARRRELRHVGESHGREAQLPEGVQEVGEDQPGRQHLGTSEHAERGEIHRDEPEAEEDQAGAELGGRIQIPAAPPERDPQGGEHRRERDDEERVHGLQPRGRHLPAEDVPIGIAVGEEIHRGAGLLVAGPESHRRRDQRHHHQHAPALDRGEPREEEQIHEVADAEHQHRPGSPGRHGDGVDFEHARHDERRSERDGRGDRHHDLPGARLLARRGDARVAEVMARPHELGETYRHAERWNCETPAPAVAVREPADDQRPDERAEVDAHVEHRETGIAPGAAFRVERRHHGAGVRLQQPDADRDDEESQEEDVRAPERQHEVAAGDQHPARHDRALRAEKAVGDPPAEEAEEIGAADVHAVDRARGLVVEAEPALGNGGHHEQNEHAAHPVVGEALPHLGEEECRESARLPEEGPGWRGGRGGGVGDLIHSRALESLLSASRSRESDPASGSGANAAGAAARMPRGRAPDAWR